MRKFAIAAGMAAALATTSACTGNKAAIGTGVGAAGGAAVGAAVGGRSLGGRIAGALIGAAIGGLAGYAIGKYLDDRDRMLQERAAAASMAYGRTGSTRAWRNAKSGNRGTVTPTSAKYRATSGKARGRICRNFSETITLANGKSETIRGQRCQKADGGWEFVSKTA